MVANNGGPTKSFPFPCRVIEDMIGVVLTGGNIHMIEVHCCGSLVSMETHKTFKMKWPRSSQGLSVWTSQPLKGSSHNPFLLFYTYSQKGSKRQYMKEVSGVFWYYNNCWRKNKLLVFVGAVWCGAMMLCGLGFVLCRADISWRYCEMGIKCGVEWGCLPTRSKQTLRQNDRVSTSVVGQRLWPHGAGKCQRSIFCTRSCMFSMGTRSRILGKRETCHNQVTHADAKT